MLSADGKTKCATCHQSEHAYSDARPLATGVFGQTIQRNAPALVNATMQKELFWDGRRESLEQAVLDPFDNPREMGFPSEEILGTLANSKTYRARFTSAFCDVAPSMATVAAALTSYIQPSLPCLRVSIQRRRTTACRVPPNEWASVYS
jgi:cytochrome c peroxidase